MLQERRDGLGFVGGIEVTGELIVATGGSHSDKATMLASPNARRFETWRCWASLGLRDILAVGDALWVCGEAGMVAVSHDRGATWTSGSRGRRRVCSAWRRRATARLGGRRRGYAARMAAGGGEAKLERVDVGTKTRLSGVYAVRDEVVMLGFDGSLRRWRRGELATAGADRAPRALINAMTVTKQSWIVVGDGGFGRGRVSRIHRGSRARSSQLEVDVEAVASLGDGRVVAVGDRGQILVSTDDGRTWRVMANELTSHLWSVKRFGGGVLIGGDDGLDRQARAAGDRDLGAIARTCSARRSRSTAAVGTAGGVRRRWAVGVLRAAGEDKKDEHQHEHEHDDGDKPFADPEPFKRLGKHGDAKSFLGDLRRRLAAARLHVLRAHTTKRDLYDTFTELRLDQDLKPERRPPQPVRARSSAATSRRSSAPISSRRSAACSRSARSGDGDTYHLELYEWNVAARRCMHFDHEEAQFDGVFADSLD